MYNAKIEIDIRYYADNKFCQLDILLQYINVMYNVKIEIDIRMNGDGWPARSL